MDRTGNMTKLRMCFLFLVCCTGIVNAAGHINFSRHASTGTIELSDPADLQNTSGAITLSYTTTDETCPGKQDGSIDLTITTSGTIQSISWSNGATTEDISGLAAGTYTVTVTDESGSATESIVIGHSTPTPTATISGDATVCQNTGTVPFTIKASGGVPPYIAHFNLNGGATLYSQSFTGETTMYQSSTNVGTYIYELESIVDANGCEWPVSGSVTIKVVSGSASVDNPGNQVFSEGETTPVISLTGSSSDVVFDISVDGDVGLADVVDVSEIPSFTAQTGTANVTVTPHSGSCTGTPVTFTITVTSTCASVTNPGNMDYCAGESTPAISLSGSPSDVLFDISGGAAIGLNDVSGVTAIPSFTAVSGTANVTITPHSGTCTGTPETFTITVVDEASVDFPGDKEYCQGETTPVIPLSGSPGNVVFDISGGVSVGLNNKTGVTAIPSFTALAGGPATITLTPRVNGCTGTPETFTITVLSKPNISAQPINQTICSGSGTSIALSSTTSGAAFSWVVKSVSPAGSITGASSGSGNALEQVLTNTTASEATIVYTVTSSVNGCSGTSMDVTVHVRPEIQGAISGTAQICQDETSPQVTFTATNGQAPYTFSYRVNGGVLATVEATSGNTVAVDAPTDVAGIFTYELVSVKDQSGCNYFISGESADITVYEKPVLTSTLFPTGICNNDLFSYTPTFSVAGTTYEWTRAVVSGISDAARSESDPINEHLENTTNDPIAVTYTFTMTSPDGCINTQDIVLVVTRMPHLTSTKTPEAICSGTIFSYEPQSEVSGTIFPWTRDAVPGISNSSASGMGNPNEVLINTTSKPIGVVYEYILSSNDCVNPEIYPVQVVVMPAPNVTASASATEICPGESIDLFSSSDVTYSSLPNTILSEDFESSALNWATTQDDNNAAWTIRNEDYKYSSRTFSSNDNSHFFLSNARSVSNNSGMWQTTTLTSPEINTVGYTSLELSYWEYYEDGASQPEIRVSTDKTNWTTVETIYNDYGTSTNFRERTIPLNGWVGKPSLYIQFYYSYTAGGAYYWAIDNVKLTGEGTDMDMYWTSDPSGFSSVDVNPTDVSPTETTSYIAWYKDPDTGCWGNDTVTVVVREQPDVTIDADYCSDPGKIILTASGASTYRWMTGETTASITVDVAGNFFVTGTDDFGCSSTASFNTATELVVNGDFEQGNVGFTSDYHYVADNPSSQTELQPEGYYSVGTSGRNFHTNFWGYDHTTGTGNYMIINGKKGLTIWEETINIQPDTRYYFSAWALSLNNIDASAKLRFEINGDQVGSTAELGAGVNSNSNPWTKRFWGEWISDATTTTAIVRIVNIEDAAGGNDFGLDDISFGTLAPAPAEVAPTAGSDVCEGSTVQLYANVSNGREPITYLWSGPEGFSSTLENPEIPNATVLNSGTYTVNVYDAYGCSNESSTVDVTVSPKVVVNAGADEEVCSDAATVVLKGTISGGTTSGSWSGGNGTFSPDAQTLNASYTPSADEIVAGFVELTLTSTDPGAPCSVVSDQMTITIHESPEVSLSTTPPLCHNGSDGKITTSVTGGQSPYSYLWDDGQTNSTATGLSAGTHFVTVTDANGCSVTGSIELAEPDKFVVNTPSYTAPNCYGGTDGTATITASGGTPPYEFIWDTAAGSQTTATATGLGAGTYSVVVLSDSHGCSATAVSVTVPEPEAPELSCPDDISVKADEGESYASNVIVPAPDYDTFCQSIEYTMTGATTGSGYDLVPSPNTFNVGTTIISYTAVNLKGEDLHCSFQVVVADVKPEIICSSPVSEDTDPDQCSAEVSVTLPQVSAGTGISWTWEMTGATEDNGTGAIPAPYTFNKGITTIHWTATNAAGTDECEQTVTVTDNQAPEFTVPANQEVCVEDIHNFTYVNQSRPDYYTFTKGDPMLDLDSSTFTDNCGFGDCTPLIEWRIVFSDGTKFPASGYLTGQPSAYASSFRFPGDGTNYLPLTHTVYYRLTDCANNTREQSITVTVSPRPDVVN